MATTFATTFKNKTIDSLTGRASTTYALRYIGFWNGVQPAAPSDTPAGSAVFSSYSVGVDISTYMSQPAGGISALSQTRQANATSAVSTITFGRLYDAGGVAQIDVVASLSGGGGGIIVPTLTSSAGVAYQVTDLSLKLPSNLGTVYLNDDLRDDLVSAWCNTAANVGAGAAAVINVYSGSVPSSANEAATGTLLVSFSTAASGASWNAASGGSAALASSLSAAASAGSATTATYARMVKGSYVLQGTVGTSGADFIMDSVTITSGNTYSITNATITI